MTHLKMHLFLETYSEQLNEKKIHKSFMTDFFESERDCALDNIYPWPRLRVVRKKDGIYICYSDKKYKLL